MNKKIIAIVCLAAMCVNLTAFAADEEIPLVLNIDEEQITEIEEDNTYKFELFNYEEKNEILNILSVDDSKERLKTLIDEVKACSPDEVAAEKSVEALSSALSSAESVYANASSDEQDIEEAIDSLKAAIEGMEYIAGQNILTNNTFSDSEQETYYSEMTGDAPTLTLIQTDASYTYDQSSPAGFTTSDSTLTRLSNGLANGRMLVNNTSDAVIVYDMGSEYYIDGVDVFSSFLYFGAAATMRQNIGSFEVEVSTDGVSYKKIASATAKTQLDEGESSGNYIIKTPAVFAASLAKFVRITVKGDEGSSRYNLNEIVIKGFKSPFSRDELYEALVSCSDVDSSVLTAQSYGNYISAYKRAESIYWNESSAGREIYDAKTALEEAYAALESDAVIKILSGNIVSEYDRNYYSAYELDTMDLSYTYQEGSNPQLVSQDAACTKLLQGNVNVLNTANCTYGTWDSALPAKILFDMGAECYISGADVWEQYTATGSGTASTRAGWVRVSVSDDGTSFTQVSEVYNTKDDAGTQTANVISQDFEPIKCRYVLVTVEKGTSHQITLNEVVLRGYRTAQKANIPYGFGILDYKNSTGTRIISLDGNDTVNVKGTIKSNSDKVRDVIVVSAVYKGDDVTDYSFASVSIDAYGTAEFENTLSLGGENGLRLYNFVWDSLEGGQALSNIKEFGNL